MLGQCLLKRTTLCELLHFECGCPTLFVAGGSPLTITATSAHQAPRCQKQHTQYPARIWSIRGVLFQDTDENLWCVHHRHKWVNL